MEKQTYYQRNKAKILEKQKLYYKKNGEKIRAYIKKHQTENIERKHKYQKEYRNKTKEKRSQYYIEWYAKNGRNRNENHIERVSEWKRLFPEKARIQDQLIYYVKKGDIIRPETCPRCGRKTKIHAHHVDYDHYTHFIWLCASCHKKEHSLLDKL